MSNDMCNERLTKLETKQEMFIRDFRDHSSKEELHQEKQTECQNRQTEMLQDILEEQASNKGFWQGMVFSVTALGAGIGIVIQWFLKGS